MTLHSKRSARATMDNQQSWPFYEEDEIAAVQEVLRSGRVNQWTGDRVTAFEEAAANTFQTRHALAVSNGSVALELALRALNIGPGDEVIVTSRSYVASATCVLVVGAIPIFADINRQSQNITVETIRPLITEKTKAIIPVHLAGWPCDMQAIMALAEDHNLLVVEDCAQAVGAAINGRSVGSFGHAATLSFCQDKIISTGGEGGMVFFQDGECYERAWQYKDHGKSIEARKPGANLGFRWLHDTVGTNWRLTELQAAIGILQLKKLAGWLEKRRRNAAIWRDALSATSCIDIPAPENHFEHAYYKFYAFVRPERLQAGSTRDTLLTALQDSGIVAFSGSCPEIYREKVFSDFAVETRPVARELGETSLMFEVHPTLDPDDLRDTAEKASAIIAKVSAN